MLSIVEMASIRRHFGVPVVGVPNSSYTMGVRTWDAENAYFQSVGLLEARIRDLQPHEESPLTGKPIAAAVIMGAINSPGTLTVSVTVNTTTTTLGAYTASGGDLSNVEPLFRVCQSIANVINAANLGYIAMAGEHTAGNQVVVPQAQFTVSNTSQTAFTLNVTGNSFGAVVLSQGVLPQPQITPADIGTTLYGYLPILDYLESKIASAGDFAAYEQADVVKFSQAEGAKRAGLYNYWRKRLSSYLGVRLNPLGNPNSTGKGGVA